MIPWHLPILLVVVVVAVVMDPGDHIGDRRFRGYLLIVLAMFLLLIR